MTALDRVVAGIDSDRVLSYSLLTRVCRNQTLSSTGYDTN